MPVTHIAQLLRLMTFLARVFASGREAAARRRIDGRDHLALYRLDALSAPRDVDDGNRRQQRLRIRMQRMGKQLFRRRIFHALTQIHDHAKVPAFEQLLSSGAAIQNFLLSLQAQGFASMWRTGAVVESQWLKQQLGLQPHDFISGIIYIGTAAKAIPARADIQTQDFVQFWTA